MSNRYFRVRRQRRGTESEVRLYLFRLPDTDLFALSIDRSGTNIPTPQHRDAWDFVERVNEEAVVEFGKNPEFPSVYALVLEQGYHVFQGELIPDAGNA